MSGAPHGDEATLFRTHHRSLLRAVAQRVSAPAALIEDACGFAWQQLLVHQPDRDTVLGWLYVVAVREALRLVAQPQPRPMESDVPDAAADVAAVVEAHARLAALGGRLSARRRRMLGLHAAGFTYREIAEITGDSLRTVDRQLRHARQGLREPTDAT